MIDQNLYEFKIYNVQIRIYHEFRCLDFTFLHSLLLYAVILIVNDFFSRYVF